MKNEATSIHIITESSDHYNYLEEIEFTTESLIDWLKEQLGDEFAYISNISIQTLGYDEDNIDLKSVYKAIDKALEEAF